MKPSITEEKNFDKTDFRESPLPKGEYEYCTFSNCDFSNSDLSNVFFLECVFAGCNLSMVDLAKTTLRDVKFKDCKMLGVRFDNCNQFGFAISIDGSTLNHASFYQTKLIKTTFKNSSLQEVDFTGCDLTNSLFDNCDLTGATFENTNIEKADFRTSFNYSINLEINRHKKARFSLPGAVGLLHKYDIDIENH